MGHGEERQGAWTIRGGVDLGDDGMIVSVIRIVDEPLLPLDMVLLAGGVIGQGRGAGAEAQEVSAGMLFRPSEGEDFAFELGGELIFFGGDQHHIGESTGGAGGHVTGVIAEVPGRFEHGAQQVECGVDIVQHIHHTSAQALIIENVAELRVFNRCPQI